MIFVLYVDNMKKKGVEVGRMEDKIAIEVEEAFSANNKEWKVEVWKVEEEKRKEAEKLKARIEAFRARSKAQEKPLEGGPSQPKVAVSGVTDVGAESVNVSGSTPSVVIKTTGRVLDTANDRGLPAVRVSRMRVCHKGIFCRVDES
jgi:hypothetical protein